MGDNYHITPGFDMRGAAYNEPPRLDVLHRAWFDKWLTGIDNGIEKYGPVTLKQQGGGWTTTTGFPHPGVEYQRMYLSAAPSGTGGHSRRDGSLVAAKPADNARLTVAPGLRSICSRDSAQSTARITGILPFCSTDERFREAEGLTFTSTPVPEEVTISGPIALHLNTVLDATDGYWTTTVNDVAHDGKSTVLTSGQLVVSVREVDDSRSKRSKNGDYTDPVPYIELERHKPLVPGQPTTVDIQVTATEAVLKPGHRLRIDVFASNFPKGQPLGPFFFPSGAKPRHLQLDPSAPSFVNIATSGRSGW